MYKKTLVYKNVNAGKTLMYENSLYTKNINIQKKRLKYKNVLKCNT